MPAIRLVELQNGADGITVSWFFLHTGGSDIDQVEILLRPDMDGSTFELVQNTSRSSNDTFLIRGELLQAGVSYLVGVRAGNEFGVSELTVSDTLEATIGMLIENRGQCILTHCINMIDNSDVYVFCLLSQ